MWAGEGRLLRFKMVREIKVPKHLKEKFSCEPTDSELIRELLEGYDGVHKNKQDKLGTRKGDTYKKRK